MTHERPSKQLFLRMLAPPRLHCCDLTPPVPGRLYPLTPAELTAADAYEGEAYRRVRVRTEAGAEAWVYVATC